VQSPADVVSGLEVPIAPALDAFSQQLLGF
jgi:hypothetical protein